MGMGTLDGCVQAAGRVVMDTDINISSRGVLNKFYLKIHRNMVRY
jgi:hypothetical protein